MRASILRFSAWVVLITILSIGYYSAGSNTRDNTQENTPLKISILGLAGEGDCILMQQGDINV